VTDAIQQKVQEGVRTAVSAALDKKAFDLDVLAVGALTSIADYFILCSAGNERQAASIADNVQERLRLENGTKPLLVEGATPGHWVLLDYGDFIFHIFTEDTRRFYGLERLWGDAPNVTAEFAETAHRFARGEEDAAAPRNARKTS
jgi:ribosome-associated protein